MYQILLIINLIVVIIMIGTILLQRSEGGALGIGGGGGGLVSGRGVGNALTKATAILAAIFMVTSMALTWMTRQNVAPISILDSTPISGEEGAPMTDDMPIPPLVPLSE